MFRVWYSTESVADFIIDYTDIKKYDYIKTQLIESDANSNSFHSVPDHIKKILYLDAPDIIVEYDSEPLFSIEISEEAGTGHNVFQRFSRIVASTENNVPAFYIYPEASIVKRDDDKVVGWDKINPIIFYALERLMDIYYKPALLFYYPSRFRTMKRKPTVSDYNKHKGLIVDKHLKYAGAPDGSNPQIKKMFEMINELITKTISSNIFDARDNFIKSISVSNHRSWMNAECISKRTNKKGKVKPFNKMSPLTSTIIVPTEYILNYLSQYESLEYKIGELLRSRKETIIYQTSSEFRGDPYAGALAGIDFMTAREGSTFEDRRYNLVLVWGKVNVDDSNRIISITGRTKTSINDYVDDVKKCKRRDLLGKDYADLKNEDIPRYYMQNRYGSMFSKVKHIRVYSYFADAILFKDGALWRDA